MNILAVALLTLSPTFSFAQPITAPVPYDVAVKLSLVNHNGKQSLDVPMIGYEMTCQTGFKCNELEADIFGRTLVVNNRSKITSNTLTRQQEDFVLETLAAFAASQTAKNTEQARR